MKHFYSVKPVNSSHPLPIPPFGSGAQNEHTDPKGGKGTSQAQHLTPTIYTARGDSKPTSQPIILSRDTPSRRREYPGKSGIRKRGRRHWVHVWCSAYSRGGISKESLNGLTGCHHEKWGIIERTCGPANLMGSPYLYLRTDLWCSPLWEVRVFTRRVILFCLNWC